jgi:hypothetical protein
MKHVELRVKGHVDESWSAWLEGLTISHTESEETILTGSIPDQAALYGLISKIRDLGLQLLSVDVDEEA